MNGWAALDTELERWRRAGRVATFWWRDDDAAALVPNLERLVQLLAPIPAAFAVIPGRLTAETRRLLSTGDVAVLQHGFSHDDHGDGEPVELTDGRPLAVVQDELRRGWAALSATFGKQALPVLVPPWHRIGPKIESSLAAWGFSGISRFCPRERRMQHGLTVVNTHVDLMQWDRPPRFAGEQQVLDQLLTHLQARRQGEVDSEEPTGLLSHHRTTCNASFALIEMLLNRLSGRDEVRWVPAAAAFGSG
jgi:hypothetical protein